MRRDAVTTDPPLERRVAELERQLAEIRSKIAALERTLAARADHPADRQAVREKVTYDWQE